VQRGEKVRWTLVTGSTGTVGHALVRALRAEGRDVRCLVRHKETAAAILPAGVDLAAGDVTDAPSLAAALRDCSAVFHAAGLPEQWHPDAGVFKRVNVGGTANLVEASLLAGVSSFVYTSTQDLFDVQRDPYDETTRPQRPMTSAYEISKTRADALVERAIARGLPAIFMHPSAVYGPMSGTPTGTNRFLADLLNNRVPMLLPGGLPLVLNGNRPRRKCSRKRRRLSERATWWPNRVRRCSRSPMPCMPSSPQRRCRRSCPCGWRNSLRKAESRFLA
jgi:dihydroflavonol-4-reductase